MFLTFYSQFSTLYTKEPDMTRDFLPILGTGKPGKRLGGKLPPLCLFSSLCLDLHQFPCQLHRAFLGLHAQGKIRLFPCIEQQTSFELFGTA